MQSDNASYIDLIQDEVLRKGVANSVNMLSELCHGVAVECGWWHDPSTGEPKDRNDGEMIALMHSELSEALEAVRKDLYDDHMPWFKGVAVELADTIIRIADFAGARGIDVGSALSEKLLYNTQREDHKPENRVKEGGKAF